MEFDRYLQPCASADSVGFQLSLRHYSPAEKLFTSSPAFIYHESDSDSDDINADGNDVSFQIGEFVGTSLTKSSSDAYDVDDVYRTALNSSTDDEGLGLGNDHTDDLDLAFFLPNQLECTEKTFKTKCIWACDFDDEDIARFDICSPPACLSAASASVGRSRDRDDSAQDTNLRKLQPPPYRKQLSLPNLPLDRKSLEAHGGSSLRRNESLRRRHVSSGVRFADEVGENLSTFAIIPSRYDDPQSASTASPLSSLLSSSSSSSSSSSTSSATAVVSTTSAAGTYVTYSQLTSGFKRLLDVDRSTSSLHGDNVITSKPCKRTNCFADDSCSVDEKDLDNSSSASSSGSQLSSSSSSGELPLCRLLFEQPAGDQLSFIRRLNELFVCLENVKVIESPTASGVGSSVLCTVKVKHQVDGTADDKSASSSEPMWDFRVNDRRRVFARCTDNNWASHADISAQMINMSNYDDEIRTGGGGGTTAPVYDTYSFAIQRPFASNSDDNEPCGVERTRTGTGHRRRKHGIAGCSFVAVEFALCYKVENRSFWDNNDTKNYRIEWLA